MAGVNVLVPQQTLHEDCVLRLHRALANNPQRNTEIATAVTNSDPVRLQEEHRRAFEVSLAEWVCRTVGAQVGAVARDAAADLFHAQNRTFELRVQIVEVTP